ncbi:DUF3999 family protein [Saccharibacillus sacchari]|uniref:DUF3999 family protein n=1 Tax=Saccharibacillus sacchari TaxID=456493 RepID=A0ACC6PFD9_9BACL
MRKERTDRSRGGPGKFESLRVKKGWAAASAILLLSGVLMLPGTMQARPAENDAEASGVWTFAKEIQVTQGSRYQALFLDPDVYGRAEEDLGDVRIINSSGQFMPYYMDSGEEGERGLDREYPLELIDRAEGEKEIRFDFRVVPAADNEDIRGSRLTFSLPQASFLKKVSLDGSYDGQRWEAVTTGELYSTGEGAFRNVIELNEPAKYGYYRVKVPSGPEPFELEGMALIDVGTAVSGEDFRQSKEITFNVQPSGRMSEVVLYNADKLRIDRIKLNASASDGSSGFSRMFYVDRAKGTGLNTRVLSPDRLNRLELSGSTVEDTEIRLAEPIRSEKPMVVIDNGGNTALNIQSIRIGYRVDRLVFEDTGTGPYRLVYGAQAQETPQYDISAFRTEIEQSGPGEATLGKENASQFVPPAAEEASGADDGSGPKVGANASLQITFNLILLAVALVLIVFLGRKLRKK